MKLINADCRNVSFPPNYFDTIITDPPYGLNFMGKDWDYGIPSVPFWKKFLRWCKPGAFALIFGGTRTFHRLTCAIEDAGWEIRDCMMWLYGSGFPKSLDISKAIDKTKGVVPIDTGIKSPISWPNVQTDLYKSGKVGKNFNFTLPNTDLAKLWDGWGTALKPAWEPIIVAMKPLDGTFAHNAEKWGVGGLWIDGGRIGTNENTHRVIKVPRFKDKYAGGKGYDGRGENGIWEGGGNSLGRWPANLILDEEAGAMLDEQSGNRKGWSGQKHNVFNPYGGNALQKSKTTREGYYEGFNDSGGASRFFYCAKASRSERNTGCENLFWLDSKQIMKKLYDELKQENERNKDNKEFKKHNIAEGNIHPTVKALSLMEYLCKLTRTPTGGRVFDPFAGSGTTGLACLKTNRDFVLIEQKPEYFEILKNRIEAAQCKN